MRINAVRFVLVSSGVLGLMMAAAAQERGADPRVGLKAGFRDAGQAILNLELIASLPKPDGFFDPAEPAGTPTAPERPAAAPGAAPAGTPEATPAPAAQAPYNPAVANRL